MYPVSKKSYDKTIESDFFNKRNNKDNYSDSKEQTQVLVAESNYDFRYLYQSYLNSFGLKLEMVDSGEACLNRLFKDKNANNNNFDIVIINTHLFDIPGLDIAKEIHKKNPNQRIVIITTSSREHILKGHLDIAGIDHECILTIPFRFSNLISLIKSNKKTYMVDLSEYQFGKYYVT